MQTDLLSQITRINTRKKRMMRKRRKRTETRSD